jgi:hypothetical protein
MMELSHGAKGFAVLLYRKWRGMIVSHACGPPKLKVASSSTMKGPAQEQVMSTHSAIVVNGQLQLDIPLSLPDNSRVTVTVSP